MQRLQYICSKFLFIFCEINTNYYHNSVDEKTAVDSNGLGLLAKYAVDVLDEHSTPVKKPIKRKVDEGVCNENTQTSSTENTVTTCTTTTTTCTTTTIPTNIKPKGR